MSIVEGIWFVVYHIAIGVAIGIPLGLVAKHLYIRRLLNRKKRNTK